MNTNLSYNRDDTKTKKQVLSRLFLVVLNIALIFTSAACSATNTSSNEVGSTTQDITESIDKIRIGLSPDEDSAAVLKRYDSFIKNLSESMGMEVEPYVGADYTAVIEALNSGHLDVAWFGPSEYVLATEAAKGEVEAFASAIQAEGTVQYKSCLIVRADSGIENLNDMKGKTFAFTDPASTSGHIFARYSLVEQGITPEEYFKQVIYSGSNDASLLAVINKQVEVAAISSRNLSRYIADGLAKEDEIKIVYESVEIPADPITYRKDLPQDVKDKIKSAFLNYTPELASSLEGTGFAKFAEVDDKHYDIVRDAYKIAGLEPEL